MNRLRRRQRLLNTRGARAALEHHGELVVDVRQYSSPRVRHAIRNPLLFDLDPPIFMGFDLFWYSVIVEFYCTQG